MNTNKYLLFILCLILLSLFQIATGTQLARPHHPEKLIESLKEDAQAGEKIYKEFCAVCHDPDPQIPIGAPKIGDSEDWQYRKKSLEELTHSTANGLNNMPPRGGCFECTDELLQAAIQYMRPKENKEAK